MKTVIYLIRHAEASGNKERIFHGITDSELTENGLNQAEKLAQKLMKFKIDKVYSSDLKRARQTAEAYASKSGHEIIESRMLREINGGDWENLQWSELPDQYPESYQTWENTPHLHSMPAGESMIQLRDRIMSELYRIFNESRGGNIAVFTHGTPIRVLVCIFSGRPFSELDKIKWHENTSVTRLEAEDDVIKLVYEGCFDHLDPSQATILNQEWSRGGINE